MFLFIAWSFLFLTLIIIVGTSNKKRKQSESIKNDKKIAKKSKISSSTSTDEDICTRCHKSGHKTARSPKCQYHNASKQEVFKENLGQGFRAFTRKIPLDKCINEQYRNSFKSATISASRDIREIIYRAKLFVNYYVSFRSEQGNDIPHCIFKQQFWYSVCQLINAKRITTSTNMPADILSVWGPFKTDHGDIVFKKKLQAGASQCLAEACTELATSYQNCIVETFEDRLLRYFYYRLQNIFVVSKRKILYEYKINIQLFYFIGYGS